MNPRTRRLRRHRRAHRRFVSWVRALARATAREVTADERDRMLLREFETLTGKSIDEYLRGL
jgi:hypothetical protein